MKQLQVNRNYKLKRSYNFSRRRFNSTANLEIEHDEVSVFVIEESFLEGIHASKLSYAGKIMWLYGRPWCKNKRQVERYL